MGEAIQQYDEQEAEKLFQQGLAGCGLVESELIDLKKGDGRKKVIAWHIRKKTSVRVGWITQRLKMGVISKFSCSIRAVEESKEGLLWALKNKIKS